MCYFCYYERARVPPMSVCGLEGEWHVASIDGTRIGTATVMLDGSSSTQLGRVRFRDLRTMLHTKFRLIPDPDPVLHCGFPDDVAMAPAGRSPVMANADYEHHGTFWRSKESSTEGRIVWTKTVEHVLDPNWGWMQSWDAHDPEMGPKGALVWTRPRKPGRPPAKKKAIAPPPKEDPPKGRTEERTKASLVQRQKKRRR